MILIDKIVLSFARLRAIKLKMTLSDYIHDLIYQDISKNDKTLLESDLYSKENKQLFKDAFSDLQNEQILPLSLAKKMSKNDLHDEIYLIQAFMDITEGGQLPDHPPTDYWRKYYCSPQFVMELPVYNKYLQRAKKEGIIPRRFANKIIKEWLEKKHIDEQDEIERRAHEKG